MADVTLPLQIITDILSRLPEKPLLRFKSVSKSWYSLINSPNFIKLHLTQTLTSNSHTHVVITDHKNMSTITLDNLENHERYYRIKSTDLNPPIPKTPAFLHVHGSCNGILCISDSVNHTVFLFNPSTQSHRFLPTFHPSPSSSIPPVPSDPYDLSLVVYGVGYDSVSDDYKVLRIIQIRGYREAGVYSLRNDSWKCVNDGSQCEIMMAEGSALVNETLHLIVFDKSVWSGKPLIKCFNLRDETFSTLDLPRKGNYVSLVFSLRELGGCLCVLANYQGHKEERSSSSSYDVVPDIKLMSADFWVMKEYGNKESWVKLFSIRKPECMGSIVRIKPVVYSRDGCRVLLALDRRRLGWYDLGKDKFKRVSGVDDVEPLDGFFESLVSLEKDVVQPKTQAVLKKTRKKKNRTKDDTSSTDFKLKLGDRTKDASELGNARDDILHKEFRLRLSERTEDATDLCNA